MKTDNMSSASSTGEASATRPPPPNQPAEKLTEAEYLAQQANNAKLAIAKAWQDVKSRLGQGGSPRAWAEEYPWITVGAAAVAGFFAATALVPSKEQQALKKLAAIERALNTAPPRAEAANGNGAKEESGGMLSTILGEVIKIARPALVTLMTAGLGGQPGADGHEHGQSPEETAQ
jgi:hypothetical protein